MLLSIVLSALLSLSSPSENMEAAAYDSAPQRPKVALVLSGGGAKGLAHIGVIRYLREVGIPVDFVVGTSIGSIVGAMYCLGYDDTQMLEILYSLDWPYYLGDGVERNQMMYQQKINSDKYDLSFPFGTGELTLDNLKNNGEANHFDMLKSLMPSGVIEGNNILNLFYDMSIGYTEEMDFADLPIPFVCVSTDIVNGTANIHTHGVLPLALRASMSMPGVFNPVFTEKQALVDGGIRNNFPVDIARNMGADIVIGVNLAIEKESDPEKLKPYLSQVSQLIKIFIGNGLEENNQACDVLVYPDLKGRGSLDFSQKNMNELADIGYKEAQKHGRELQRVHDFLAEYGSCQQKYQAPKAHNLVGKTFSLSQINIKGADSQDKDWIIDHCGLSTGKNITMKNIKNAVSALYGTRAYSSVIYSLEEDGSGQYIINFELTPQKPHTLNLGLRFDNHDALQSIMRIGINEQIIHGFQAEFTAKLSYNPSFSTTLSYLPVKFPKISLSYDIMKRDADLYEDGLISNNLRYVDQRLRIYFSDMVHVKTSVKIGSQYENMSFLRAMSSYWTTSLDSKMRPIRTLSLFAEAHYDNLDNNYFPTSGSQAYFKLRENLLHFRDKGIEFRPFTVINASYKTVLNSNDHLTLLPQVYGALNFDDACHWGDENFPASYGDDMALGHSPVYPQKIGGTTMDYDFYEQLPFAGLYHTSSVGNALIARLDARCTLRGSQYLTLKMNYARAGSLNHLFTSYADNLVGVAAEYSIDTIIGPISCELGWNNLTEKIGAFISLGRTF